MPICDASKSSGKNIFQKNEDKAVLPHASQQQATPGSLASHGANDGEDRAPQQLVPSESTVSWATSEEILPEVTPRPMFARHSRGKTRFKGPTHWSLLSFEFKELAPFVFGKEPDFDRTNQELRALKQFYPIRANRNYPFRSNSTIPWTKERIRSLLPPRATTDAYIELYLNTYEKTHGMLHVPMFREEMMLFWRTPSALPYEWLSQFLMMLALGCPRHERLRRSQLVESFLDGAEAYLMQSPFQAKPNFTSIRAMAMMVIAKQIDIVAFDDSGAVWSFLGLVVRLAMCLGFHRDPQWFDSMSPLEAETRKRIWTTLVFMDVQNSLETGLPLLLHPDDYDSPAPGDQLDGQNLAEDNSNTATASQHADEANDSAFQSILSKSFPHVLHIIRLVHQPLNDTTRRVVLEAEAKIRNLRQIAADTYPKYSSDDKTDTLIPPWRQLQGILLEIYFRRVLLALHQPYVMAPDAAKRYPESCWSALESALAILVLQRRLYGEAADLVSIEWFAELFKGDFFVAALFVAVGIRRKSFGTQQKTSCPGRLAEIDIASQTLEACLAIWSSKVGLSVHHFKAHLFLGVVIAATKASEVPLHLRIQEAAAATIATVRATMLQHNENDPELQPDRSWDVGARFDVGLMQGGVLPTDLTTGGLSDVNGFHAEAPMTDQFLSELFVDDPPFAWSFD
ncbi:hypothetical protein A1O1_07144 [Capronia coronata CBS 617.96]|uniref:Xylanolytic transcriptional activator regulatory domain-containing protein n=1 Tax=Capronia coronata CBS 617.96 TaxID=1182541 RepID=W9Y2R4_9EURO|nr:uncharacterized protein A1O1_07144 [Capronia coronata CBS 617.96]EXJ83521.1 hypothetical protein A1O1_07144 [Capronia coronata CBS 617.96]